MHGLIRTEICHKVSKMHSGISKEAYRLFIFMFLRAFVAINFLKLELVFHHCNKMILFPP